MSVRSAAALAERQYETLLNKSERIPPVWRRRSV